MWIQWYPLSVDAGHLKRTLGRCHREKKVSVPTLAVFLLSAEASSGFPLLQNKDLLLRVAFQVLHSLVIFPTSFPHTVHPVIWSNIFSSLLYVPAPTPPPKEAFDSCQCLSVVEEFDLLSTTQLIFRGSEQCVPPSSVITLPDSSLPHLEPCSRFPALLDGMPHLAYMCLCPSPALGLPEGKVCIFFVFKALCHLAQCTAHNRSSINIF